MDLEEKLEIIKSKFFQKTCVKEFLVEFPLPLIIKNYIDNMGKETKLKDLLQAFLNFVSEDSIFSKMLIFQNFEIFSDLNSLKNFSFSELAPLLESILLSDDEEAKSIIIKSIMNNYEETNRRILDGEEPFEEVIKKVNVLFFLLNDEESSIGLKILGLLNIIANDCIRRKKKVWFLDGNIIAQGLKHKKEVIALRYMDLVCSLAVKNEEILDALLEQDLLQNAIDIYETSDLLTKLNAIEIISKLGSSKKTAEFIKNNKIFDMILKDATEDDKEFYIKKYSIILLVKMFSWNAIDLNLKTNKIIINFLINCFNSSSFEEIETGIEIIGYLASQQRGMNIIFSNEPLLKDYLSYFKTTKDTVKKKFLNSFAEFFENHLSKSIHHLKHIFAFLSNPQLLSSKLFSQNVPFNWEGGLSNSMNAIFPLLLTPFEDIELETLRFMVKLTRIEFGIKEFMRHQKSVEYLAKGYSKNKEIFDEKENLKNNINAYLTVVINKEAFVNEFEKNLADALNKKEKEPKMFYKTEAND